MATATYESVLEQAQQLPPEERRRLRDALDDDTDTRWDATFAQSQDQLAKLAAKARANIAAGRRIPLEPEQP